MINDANKSINFNNNILIKSNEIDFSLDAIFTFRKELLISRKISNQSPIDTKQTDVNNLSTNKNKNLLAILKVNNELNDIEKSFRKYFGYLNISKNSKKQFNLNKKNNKIKNATKSNKLKADIQKTNNVDSFVSDNNISSNIDNISLINNINKEYYENINSLQFNNINISKISSNRSIYVEQTLLYKKFIEENKENKIKQSFNKKLQCNFNGEIDDRLKYNINRNYYYNN